MSTSQSSERLAVLDGLRGLAVGLVVWYHAWLVSGQSIAYVNFIAEAGFLGVDLFFFISGFCLFYPYARAQRDGWPVPATRRFFARRIRKIVPSYVLALGVFAAIYHARFASAGDAAVQIASHLAFVHTLSPATFGAISGPLWTIGIEVQFYLIFPIIVPIVRKAPLRTYATLVVIAESYRLTVAATGWGATFSVINQLPAYLDVFGSGMLAAHLLTTLPEPANASARRRYTAASGLAFGAAILALGIVSAIGRSADVDAVYGWVNATRWAIGPICIALAISTTFAVRRWREAISAPGLAFLSLISYNVYLWNLEITVWYRAAGFSPAATFALGMLTSLAVATAITFGFERPILFADLGAVRRALRLRPARFAGAISVDDPALG